LDVGTGTGEVLLQADPKALRVGIDLSLSNKQVLAYSPFGLFHEVSHKTFGSHTLWQGKVGIFYTLIGK
jgi:hypothetical protein